jgi:hypothetical protein
MRISLIVLFVYLINFSSAFALKDCPGDMVLWKGTSAGASTCRCPTGQTMKADFTAGITKFGICTETNTHFPNTPTNIASQFGLTLSLWLDGDDPYANGYKPARNTAISSWKDKSGNNRHATQAVAANRPVYDTLIAYQMGYDRVPATVSGIKFTQASSHHFTLASFGNIIPTGNANYTVFAVVLLLVMVHMLR